MWNLYSIFLLFARILPNCHDVKQVDKAYASQELDQGDDIKFMDIKDKLDLNFILIWVQISAKDSIKQRNVEV